MKVKPSSLFVLAILITAAMGLAGSAYAQEITIETSAGDHDNRFFGGGVLRIVVTDPDVDDSTVNDIEVTIEADPAGGSGGSIDITVPETDDDSGRFELFLVHVDATAVEPADINPTNGAGVEGDGTCVIDCAPFVTFGPAGDLDASADLYDDVRFEIMAGNTEIVVDYEESAGVLELDRDSYGTTSYVYISVVDQDANLNPTERDEFTVDPDDDPNGDLLTLDGGSFEDVITFRETADNSAVFEGRYRLGESMLVSSESLALTLFDKANYNATLAAPENDSNDTYEIGFTVGNSDGTIGGVGGQQPIATWNPVIDVDKDSYALGESVSVTVVDQDANVDSGEADSIDLRVSSGTSELLLTAIETDMNTGVFEASFMLSEETGEGVIEPSGSATITYTDERPADYSEMVQAGQSPEKDFAIEIDIQLPIRTGIEATDVTVPIPKDVTGGAGPLTIGNSVTLSTVVSNNNDAPQPYVALIEVRDSSGVTVFLALQDGTLDPSGSTEIGVLWQPNKADTFKVRAFVVSNLIGGIILSPLAESEVMIS